MITEDYVSFETAKLLKENGFDEECSCFYDNIVDYGTPGLEVDGQLYYKNSALDDEEYAAPTLQMAMKWFEEKHGIFYVIRRHGNKDGGFTYSWNCEGKRGLSVGNGGRFKTAAEAREAAIKYCLENLI